MASKVASPKCSNHVRSISLPCRGHPLGMTIEEQLKRIRSSEAVSTSSVSSASKKLGGLKDLYDCVADLLQLPHTRQLLSHEHQRSSAEDLLDGSMKLLDVCGNTREFILEIKEHIQELELSFRRRRGEDLALADEVVAYAASRKKLQKSISKYLVNLRKAEKKACLSDEATLSMLREVERISLSVLISLLSFLSQTSANSKPSGWVRVSKLLPSKRVSCDGEENTNEMVNLDSELLHLKSGKVDNIQASGVLKQLEALELNLQEIEEDMECVYRRLVKIRVSLLNIVSY